MGRTMLQHALYEYRYYIIIATAVVIALVAITIGIAPHIRHIENPYDQKRLRTLLANALMLAALLCAIILFYEMIYLFG